MSTNQMEIELLHTSFCWLGPTLYWGRDGILQSIGAGVDGMGVVWLVGAVTECMEKRSLNLSPWSISLSILAGAIYLEWDERILRTP